MSYPPLQTNSPTSSDTQDLKTPCWRHWFSTGGKSPLCVPHNILTESGVIFGCHLWGCAGHWHPVGRGQRCLSTSYRAEGSPTTENYPARKVTIAAVRNPVCRKMKGGWENLRSHGEPTLRSLRLIYACVHFSTCKLMPPKDPG